MRAGSAPRRHLYSIGVELRTGDVTLHEEAGRVGIRQCDELSPARKLGRVDLGGSPPRPPTDPDVHVNASGSSSQDFAAPLSRPWTTRAGGRR